MANIPDYTALGTPQDPTPAPARRLALEGDMSGEVLAQAGEELGRSIATLGSDIYDRQQKDKIQAVNLARAQAANATVDHQISLQTIVEKTREGIASGDIPYEGARQHFNDQVAALPTPQIPNLDPVGQENFHKQLIRNIATTGFQVDTAVDTARRQDFQDQFVGNIDRLRKRAAMPGADIEAINAQADAFRPLARQAGLQGPKVDEAIQNFKDANWFDQATQRSMMAKDDWNALKTLQHDLTGADGFYAGKLDANKRNEVLRGVVNDQLILQNRWEHEADKREAKASQVVRQVGEQIASTIPLTPQMWVDAQAKVKGTSYEDEFNQLQQGEQKVQEVLRLQPAQQMSYLQEQSAKLDKGGTLQDAANLVRLQSAIGKNQHLMEDAPLLWSANRNGTDATPIDFSGLASDQGQVQIGQAMTDRMATIQALRAKEGPQIGNKPLLPQEAAQLSSYLQTIDPKQRALTLTAFRRSISDDDTYQAAMDQIAPHSPVTAIAGTMIGTSAPSRTPVWFDQNYAPKIDDAQLVLQGEALLNPEAAGKVAAGEQEKGGMKGGMPMPPDTGPNGLRQIFGNAASDMFRGRPDAADAYYSVFKDAYAALLARSGDMKGTPNTQLQRQALQVALGNTVTFNGNQISVPAGMEPGRFNGLVRSAVAQAAKDQKAPEDWQDRLSGYQLLELGRTVGSGRYVLTIGGMPAVRPDGKGYFTIDLKGQYDPSKGAKPAHARVYAGVPEGYLYDDATHTYKPDPNIPRNALSGPWGSSQ